MANLFESRGGNSDESEIKVPEYRTIPKSSFTENQYISEMRKIGSLTHSKWLNRIINYYRNNDEIIDPSQDGLIDDDLETMLKQYPIYLERNNSLNNRYITLNQSEDRLSNILDNHLSDEDEKEINEAVPPSTTEIIELSSEQQTEIEARKANYQYPTRIAREGDYVRGMTLPEWLQIEEGSSEHTTLIKGIKTNGIMPSLGKLGSNIKDQKANNDISGEYLAFINATREFYGLAPYVSEPEELVLENPTVNQLEFDLDGQQEPTPVVETESGTTPASEGLAEGGVNETKKLTRADFAPMPEDPYDIKNNDLEALNNLFVSKADQFPNGKYVDIRNWADWTPITVVKPENINDPNLQWSITKGNNNELIGEFPSEEDAEAEFNRIKNEDKQKALDLLRKARNFAIGVDLEAPWTDSVDISAETLTPGEDTTPIDSVPERLADDGRVSEDPTPVEYLEVDQDPKGDEVSEDKLPGAEALQAELDRLIEESVEKENNKVTETVGKLARIEGREYTGEVDSEEIVSAMEVEILRENARQSILEYQKFIEINRNNLKDEKIYNQYRIIEKKAWSQVSKFTHELGGEMATLSQERDIQLAHPEVVDIEKYLVDGGKIVLDAEGHITHLNINGNIIELNRPRTIDELLRAPRPTRILYHSGTPISEDDPTKQNYKGLVISGLNENTLEWIEGVLSDKQFLESVIVDETTQQNPELDGNQEEVAILGNAGNVLDSETVTQSPEQAEGGENLPIDNPDRGSLYCQEIQLWNNIQALENRQKENPKDELVKVELHKAKQAYKEFRTDISTSPEQDKFQKFLELRELYAQAESENTRGRIQKLFRLKKNNSSELENIRSQYNEALEALLKTETIIGVEGKIKEMFSDEVQRLSGERVVQTKELQEKNQSGLDRALNPLKDRIFNWYIKNKSAVGVVNLGLFATSTLLAFTGAGIPLAGAVNTLRHTIAYPMAAASGISSRELIRSKFEDENTNLNLDIKKFNFKTNFEFLKFKGGITKLVDKSLRDNYIQNASDEDLSKLVSTLESYYGLNGGKFTELTQQKAYEMGLNELGARLERANNQSTDEQDISNESNAVDGLDYKFDFKNTKEFKIKTVEGLVTRISQDRISALNAQKNKRLVANVAGTALGSSLLFNLVAQDLQFNKPNLGDSASTTGEIRPKPTTGGATPDTQAPGAGPGSSVGASAPEAGAGVTKTIPDTSPTGTGASAEEALRQAQVVAEQAQELAQDVSSLDSGETIWSQASKWLGPDASQGQIQEAVEKYLGSIKGQDTIFKLANQTEGGRELLSQWGVDTAGEMAGLSKEQLYEVSKYLGEGKLDGLTELSLDNLDALEQAEYVAPSPTEVPTIEPGSTETPAPPAAEAPVPPPAPEVPPVASTEFTRGVSEALGTTNLTEAQLQEIIHSFATSEQGSVDLYNQIISNEEGARFLSGFGVNNPADFTKLTPDQIYEIAQTIGVENLDQLQGFELNEIILSKFEDAPDMVELVRGTRPLDVVQRYIANEVGNLPYDTNLGKQVLDTYLQTDSGKQWLYDAIVSNPNPNNQNVQLFREYLSFKGIKSVEDFKELFNWAEFSGNRNIPTSGFWNQIRLPNGGTRLQPLSTFLQPSQMLGIKDAVRQVLTR